MKNNEVVDFVKNYVKEHPAIMQTYVKAGVLTMNYTLMSLNAFTQHLISLQGLKVEELSKETLELRDDLNSAFNEKNNDDKALDNDYDLSWVHKYIQEIGEIKKKLGFLNFDTSINKTFDEIPKDLKYPINKQITVSLMNDILKEDGAVMDPKYNPNRIRAYSADEVEKAEARGHISISSPKLDEKNERLIHKANQELFAKLIKAEALDRIEDELEQNTLEENDVYEKIDDDQSSVNLSEEMAKGIETSSSASIRNQSTAKVLTKVLTMLSEQVDSPIEKTVLEPLLNRIKKLLGSFGEY